MEDPSFVLISAFASSQRKPNPTPATAFARSLALLHTSGSRMSSKNSWPFGVNLLIITPPKCAIFVLPAGEQPCVDGLN